MEIEEIPVVYASDENFLKQTYVSIYSVLVNRKENYFIKFFILVPQECLQIEYDANWNYEQYSIEYIHISEEYFKNVNMMIQHITKPTYYRLLIPNILPMYERCIYLDGDTICCKDICELYKRNLGDNFLAASMGAMLSFDEEYLKRVLDVENAQYYINAGVLVMNLKQMRQKKMVEKFIEYSDKEYPGQDQDVLNKCCYGRIQLLPLKYNVYANVFVEPKEMLVNRFTLSEIEEAVTDFVIIHYPREYSKPWKNLKCVKGDVWWNYAKKALDKEKVLEIQKTAREWGEEYSYIRLFDRIKKCTQLVLFGFSEIGKQFCNEIDNKFSNRVVAFCDNAKEKQGLEYNGYKVISPEELKEKYAQSLVVITSQNYSDIIGKQLLGMGIQIDNIVIYRKKNLEYVYSFDKKYWFEMWNDVIQDKISTRECLERGLKEIEECIQNISNEKM